MAGVKVAWQHHVWPAHGYMSS